MNHLTKTLIAVTITMLAGNALATKPYFGDTLYLRVGGMEQKADLTFSSTRDDRPTYKLNLDDLGMDDNASTVWASLNWQYAESWGLGFTYSGFHTSGQEIASESGNFGDIEWSASAALDSEYDLDLYIVDLHWDFINTERSHFGIGVGLHVADISAGIGYTLTGSINGQEGVIERDVETASLTAPLPNVLLRAGHQFGDHFYLGVTGGYFTLKYKDIDGELISGRATFDWRPTKHFGVGIGYQYVNIDVTDDGGNRKKKVETDVYGPILFVTVGF